MRIASRGPIALALAGAVLVAGCGPQAQTSPPTRPTDTPAATTAAPTTAAVVTAAPTASPAASPLPSPSAVAVAEPSAPPAEATAEPTQSAPTAAPLQQPTAAQTAAPAAQPPAPVPTAPPATAPPATATPPPPATAPPPPAATGTPGGFVFPTLFVTITDNRNGHLGALVNPGATCSATARFPDGVTVIQLSTQVVPPSSVVSWSYAPAPPSSNLGLHTVTCTSGSERQTAQAKFTAN